MDPNHSSRNDSVEFPNVCLSPAPPAPLIPIPYPNVQYEKNIKIANKIDARAKVGNKLAIELQQEAITNLHSATGKSVTSASQATMLGRTVHMGGMNVKVEGKNTPRTRMQSSTSHNDSAAPPGHRIAPSQMKVLLLSP